MSRTRIKFCGLRSPADIEAAANAGADAVGFVFHPASKRHVQAADVAAWWRDAPPFLASVFLFMDASAEAVDAVLQQVQPDYLQFHGDESPNFCAGFGRPWIKALPMGDPARGRAMAAAHHAAAALLSDSHGGAQRSGGSGHAFDWGQLAGLPPRLIVAGGLDASRVGALIRAHRPWGVDVSSGIVDTPGRKSALRMEAFAAAVREADAASPPPTEDPPSP